MIHFSSFSWVVCCLLVQFSSITNSSPVSCYYLLQSHFTCSLRLYPKPQPEFIFVLSFICFNVYHPLGPFISSSCCGLLSCSDHLSKLLTTTVSFFSIFHCQPYYNLSLHEVRVFNVEYVCWLFSSTYIMLGWGVPFFVQHMRHFINTKNIHESVSWLIMFLFLFFFNIIQWSFPSDVFTFMSLTVLWY